MKSWPLLFKTVKEIAMSHDHRALVAQFRETLDATTI
jgi:hypothetical protein